MLYYLIVCRSLTYAQRTAAALERAGITAPASSAPPRASRGRGAATRSKYPSAVCPTPCGSSSGRSLSPKRIYHHRRGRQLSGGGAVIYLDSAATTLQKPPVGGPGQPPGPLTTWPARDGEGTGPAMAAAETAFACREAAAELFHVPEPGAGGLHLQRHPWTEHRHQNPGQAWGAGW